MNIRKGQHITSPDNKHHYFVLEEIGGELLLKYNGKTEITVLAKTIEVLVTEKGYKVTD